MSNPRYALCNRKQQRRVWRARALPCYICGRGIDYTLQAPDPLSWVIDETVPLAHGGTLTDDNQGPAHRWCNRVKGTHSLQWARREVRRRIDSGDSPFTRKPDMPRIKSSNWWG